MLIVEASGVGIVEASGVGRVSNANRHPVQVKDAIL